MFGIGYLENIMLVNYPSWHQAYQSSRKLHHFESRSIQENSAFGDSHTLKKQFLNSLLKVPYWHVLVEGKFYFYVLDTTKKNYTEPSL